ncbi:hypothetical protein BIV57_15225 [Mangrovactinospora gilvigrisea]|uniref:DUF445 domain-containing protein n=1 Tax=Mangrovactinospora gilvigrisea TaxID=1428644 RepID=A0A1J7CAH8_9ACTN|nr:DUF445 domain-containing protein [Mangrovactinospora gilvigrisea]OIV36658.1 hypothetical protein BIV57_15225 [Mangrovactinospora gilvigrisea]
MASRSSAEADAERRRGVRRMKTVASGFLVFATIVYVLAFWAERAGAGGWAGYVKAAAEAGMVGGLADWFAVTALFRHPLGIPITHTAIIPNKKDALADGLGNFVGENFLSEAVIRQRLRSAGISSRLGGWLAKPESAARVTKEAASALRGALTILKDEDIQDIVGESITRKASAQQVAGPLGELLEKMVSEGGHHRAVDLVFSKAHDWLVTHQDNVMAAVLNDTPGWTPKFVDRKVGERVYKEVLRFVTAVRDDPEHASRAAIDSFLQDFANELRNDPDTMMKAERLKIEVLSRPEVQELIRSAWTSVRTLMVEAAEDEDSTLRVRVRSGIQSFGEKLSTDPNLQGKADGWLEDAAAYLVGTYRKEITSLITDTVKAWDAIETSKKIENFVGRDLQFIRINGTVVGSMAGLLIYTLSQLAS